MTSFLPKSYYTDNLTLKGIPYKLGVPGVSDEMAAAINPARYKFYNDYLNALADPKGQEIADQVLAIENTTRLSRQQMEERIGKVVNTLHGLFNKDVFVKKPTVLNEAEMKASVEAEKAELIEAENRQKSLIKEINGRISSIDPKAEISLHTNTKTSASNGDPAKIIGGIASMTGGTENKMQQFLDTFNDLKANYNADNVRDALVAYDQDPITGPSTEAITSTDRVVFIAMTFVLRSISLFVIQWGLNTYMIRTFSSAFKLYLLTYVGLFVLWVMLVNAVEKDLVFRMLFYYVSVDPHGYGRIFFHLFILLIFLPIPLLVKTRTYQDQEEEELTFERRRSIFHLLSMLTFFIWVISSAIASQY